MNNKVILATAIITALAASPAFADKGKKHGHYHDHHYSDTARVISVEALYRTVSVTRPERECWVEEVEYSRPVHHGHSAAGTIIGGLIGGAIGNNVTHDRHAPAVGAIIGSVIGRDMAGQRSPRRYETVEEEYCRTVHNTYEEERSDGYRVTYRYHGKTYTTRMDYDPGDTVQVDVNVRPVHHH
jgi:uncharacterized protein YcfJ